MRDMQMEKGKRLSWKASAVRCSTVCSELLNRGERLAVATFSPPVSLRSARRMADFAYSLLALVLQLLFLLVFVQRLVVCFLALFVWLL